MADWHKKAESLSFPQYAFINGQEVKSSNSETLPVENPATGKIINHIPLCTKEDVGKAVITARETFNKSDWVKNNTFRKTCLLQLANLMERHAQTLALFDCIEAGKPISDCINIDVPESIDCIRWYAESIDKLYGQVAPSDNNHLGLIAQEPIGVVAAVLPWNFPLLMAAWKLGPALASGNTVIVKPAEQTPSSTFFLAKLAMEAGFPSGVLQVITGPGEISGKAIGLHADIDMVSFTGSTEVGRLFLQYAANSNLKKVVLECGGKSPQVVLEDADDINNITKEICTAAFWNMGENCTCGSRLIVPQNKAALFLDAITNELTNWPVGSPLNEKTKIGALIEKAHFNKVLSYIEKGKKEGAHLAYGGDVLFKESGGYFIGPTIFSNVNNQMAIAQDEIFGPVLSIITYQNEKEAIQIANDTPYGLAASIYTNNLAKAHQIAKQIKAGTVSVNAYSEGNIATPFGGYKLSGFGGRDNGMQAFHQYTETKTIYLHL